MSVTIPESLLMNTSDPNTSDPNTSDPNANETRLQVTVFRNGSLFPTTTSVHRDLALGARNWTVVTNVVTVSVGTYSQNCTVIRKGNALFKRRTQHILFTVIWHRTYGQRNEGRKKMLYLTTHSIHFIYGYMASDMSEEGRKEGRKCFI